GRRQVEAEKDSKGIRAAGRPESFAGNVTEPKINTGRKRRMPPVIIRQQLIDSLRLDLVGPDRGLGTPNEVLPQGPSRWYLTGFLVPMEAEEPKKAEESSTEGLDEVSDAKGLDDASTPEPAAARRAYLPSSIGMSLLVPADTKELTV